MTFCLNGQNLNYAKQINILFWESCQILELVHLV